ncbi:hypothetical protein K474DRAFT_1777212 [Panus rudis PR-1116 ss-1]|nr:hypothetical protein K474DRAFT_1777212 [Panus rudis PR-1116 ss-1]
MEGSTLELQDFVEEELLERLREIVNKLADRLSDADADADERDDTEKQKSYTLSSVPRGVLEDFGVRVHAVGFKLGVLEDLVRNTLYSDGAAAILHDLAEDIRFLIQHVRTDTSDDVTRMILDTLALSMAELVRQRSDNTKDLYVFSCIDVTWNDEPVCVQHPTTKRTLCLSGNVDYGILQYRTDEPSVRTPLKHNTRCILKHLHDGKYEHNKSLGRFVAFRGNSTFARRPGPVDVDLRSRGIKEVVCEMLALMETSSGKTPAFSRVHYCLTNGTTWLPCLLTKENGHVDCYFITGKSGRGFDLDEANQDITDEANQEMTNGDAPSSDEPVPNVRVQDALSQIVSVLLCMADPNFDLMTLLDLPAPTVDVSPIDNRG